MEFNSDYINQNISNSLIENQLSSVNEQENSLNKNLDKKKLKQSAEEFESMFIQFSLKQMRPSKTEKGLFSGGMAEDIFRQFMDEAIAKDIAKSPNNFGIGEAVVREIGSRDISQD